MKRILLLFFVLLICIPISGCFGPSNIQLFNETIESIRSFFSIEKYDDERKEEREALEKKINKNLKNLGFDGEDGKVNINKEVIEEYLAEYSSDQLMASLYTLQLYLSEIDWSFYSIDHSWGGDCPCQEFKTIMDDFIEVANIDLKVLSIDMLNSEGYYTENSNAKPQPETREVEGEFYNQAGENLHIETKTEKQTVEYYGDFAIATQKGYSYSEGKYGWINGVFYDEVPSWKPYTSQSLWYKGNDLKIWSENLSDCKMKVYETNDRLYLIIDDEFYNEHCMESHIFYKIVCRQIEQ